MDTPAQSNVPALISHFVSDSPNAHSIVDGELVVTYGELGIRSDHLSAYLSSLGVRQDSVVAVCIERSAAQIIGALAIMKAGGAYLPLNPTLPTERLQFTLRDARADIVLIASEEPPQADLRNLRTVRLNRDGSISNDATLSINAPCVQPSDLAYVIYTSGSTGQPKGVEISHAALANLAAWHRNTFEVTPNDRGSYVSAVGFDAAVWEVWPYLTAGASVCVASDAIAREPTLLADWLIAQDIAIAFVSTPIAERLLDLCYPPNITLRVMLTGADVLHRYPPRTLPFELHNNYGPTEAAVVAASGHIKPAADDAKDLPSIGRPIDNTEIYILSEKGVIVADGDEGEICIAGIGLARGYRHQPELTAEKFVNVTVDGTLSVRIYRTGDRGRRYDDGQLAFLGRIDDQVKLRGFRIEPREIEFAINSHVGVVESAAIVRCIGAGEKELVAYIVSKTAFTAEEMQTFLSTLLPEHMIPSRFFQLSKLPITVNGKIDRSELSRKEYPEILATAAYVAAESVTEQRITEIISSLLKVDSISVNADFFRLGGHSLLGTQLISRIRDAFGVKITLRFVFETPTIAGLAAEVERQVMERLETGESSLSSKRLSLSSRAMNREATSS